MSNSLLSYLTLKSSAVNGLISRLNIMQDSVVPVDVRFKTLLSQCTLAVVFFFTMTSASLEAQSQSESVLQKETIRRQELVLRAVKQLDEAERLIQLGNNPEARVAIGEILEQIPNAGEGAPVYLRASAMVSRLDTSEGIKAFEAKKYFEARDRALSALKYDKNNPKAQELLLKTNELLGIKKDGKPQSPAVDPKFIGNLNKINSNITKARDFMLTGNYALAEEELEQALALDPYHKVAAEEQMKLYKKMGRSKGIAAKSSRQERLTETRNGWTEVYQVENNLETKTSAIVPITGKANFLVSQKLQSLVIKDVDFTDATIDDAVSFLTAKSREVDSEGSGISFIVKNEKARTEAKPFSLRLSNVPIGEVLRYICNIAGVKYKAEEFAVFIVPLSDGDDAVMVTREFPVKETFFDTSNTTSSEDATGTANTRRSRTNVTNTVGKNDDPVRKSLQERGVQFPDGSAAIYNSATGILTIKNTQDQVDLVEELVTIDQGETLLVKVETKLIEINQTDLDSLAFNYNLAGAYPVNGGSSKMAGGNIQSGTALQGSNGLSVTDRVQTFLDGASATQPQNSVSVPNRFGVSGAIDGNRFQALLEALSQKTSTDLVTAPSVVVNDGQSANVLVAREFYYPTEFDQASASSAIVANRSLAANGYTISPSFPTEFKSRNVGVSMIVQPRITVDRQRVFLTLKPEVTEFDGFINYGSQIFDPNVPGTVLSANVVNQPVFSTKIVENAQLEIQDGYTDGIRWVDSRRYFHRGR